MLDLPLPRYSWIAMRLALGGVPKPPVDNAESFRVRSEPFSKIPVKKCSKRLVDCFASFLKNFCSLPVKFGHCIFV